jgi:hypothetical protein
MASSAIGFVLAAGGIEIANEALFAPIVNHTSPWTNLNWRLVPATAVLALVLGGIEKINAPFGKGLGVLVLMSVLIIPVGKAPTPLQNITKVVVG